MIDKKSNKPEGFGRVIRSDGGKFVDLLFKNGEQNGFARDMWEDGEHFIGQCINGQPDGIWKCYNQKGELHKHEEYSKGKLIKEW